MAALKDLKSQLRSLSKQMPFALSQALTSAARENAAAEKKALTCRLESTTPFTVNAVGSTGARKNNLKAKIFVRDIAASLTCSLLTHTSRY